ncbi:MAG: 4Fe-4S binding protein [Acidobacteriota bacterium]
MAVIIDYALCEGSGFCAQVCPEDVFEHKDGETRIVNENACTYCYLCVENCPNNAITLE